MRKTLKLSISLVLALVMLFAVAIIASAGTEPTASGECGNKGNNALWAYYEDTKTLVISGSGSLMTYRNGLGQATYTTTPWKNYRTSVEHLIIEPGIAIIGQYNFAGFNALTEVTIPDTVHTLGEAAFYNCKALKTVNLGSGITDMHNKVFFRDAGGLNINVKSLTDWFEIKFHYPNSNPARSGSLSVNGVLATDIEIPADVTSVQDYAFFKVTSIKNVTFHENVTNIGYMSFAGASALESATFDGCEVAIDDYAFKSIVRGVFTDLYITNPVAWFNCSFTTPQSNPMFTGKLDVHINGVKLSAEKTDKVDFVVPEGVTSIPQYAFYSRLSLNSLTIPASVTSINATSKDFGAFCYCYNLATVYGEAGSYAETYANKYKYNFVAITPDAATGIEVDSADIELASGTQFQANATITPATATTTAAVWSSSNIAVATVSNGLVTAVGAGTATITVSTSDGAYSDSFVVTVPVVKAQSIALSQATATLTVGHKLALSAIFTPANTTNKTVTWYSNNKEVAKVVSTTGIVTAVSGGQATITAIAADGAKATCIITVDDPNAVEVKVTGVTVDVAGATLVPAETLQLTATVAPADATDKSVVWTSSADAVATVNNNGLVTAVADGVATITVTTVDGGFTATCQIVVESPEVEDVPVEEIFLDTDNLELVIGDAYTFVVTYNPTNTTETEFYWEIDDNSVVDFNEEGELVALSEGNTYVYAVSEYNEDVYFECYVTVVSGRAVTGIALDKTTANLVVSDTLTLNVTFTPDNATNKNIIWTTDKETVATVEGGVVTAVGSGVAIITATSEDNPELTATCKIIVDGTNETPSIPW